MVWGHSDTQGLRTALFLLLPLARASIDGSKGNDQEGAGEFGLNGDAEIVVNGLRWDLTVFTLTPRAAAIVATRMGRATRSAMRAS